LHEAREGVAVMGDFWLWLTMAFRSFWEDISVWVYAVLIVLMTVVILGMAL